MTSEGGDTMDYETDLDVCGCDWEGDSDSTD